MILAATKMSRGMLDQAISRANMMIEDLVTYQNCDVRKISCCLALFIQVLPGSIQVSNIWLF